ncbi:MAG: hypothetical protein P4L67_05160 [Candidatus Pacebacteria bacterium]|nr:hypothetical protein [Candidatus Paceibacterota bacterium]
MAETSELLKEIRHVLDSENTEIIDLYDALEKAAEFIEGCGKPTEKIKAKSNTTKGLLEACLCGKSPVVLDNTANGKWSIGCYQAFFGLMPGETECKDRPAVVEAESRGHAVETWNELIVRRRNA